MTEQSNTAWGLTVSRRFDTASEANSAVQGLKSAGFREDEIRVWQQKKQSSGAAEDAFQRILESLLGGAVIGGLLGLFVSTGYFWTMNESVTEESPAIITLGAAVGAAVVVALLMLVISRKLQFQHHESHAPEEAPSVVTVTVGDREAQAKQVFDSQG